MTMPRISPPDLNDLRLDCRLTPREAAALLSVSYRTWQRWQKVGAPSWAGVVLRLRAGYLDDLGWPGWRIIKGKLVTHHWPYETTPGHILASWWQAQELVLSRKELRQIGADVKVKKSTFRLVNKELCKGK